MHRSPLTKALPPILQASVSVAVPTAPPSPFCLSAVTAPPSQQPYSSALARAHTSSIADPKHANGLHAVE